MSDWASVCTCERSARDPGVRRENGVSRHRSEYTLVRIYGGRCSASVQERRVCVSHAPVALEHGVQTLVLLDHDSTKRSIFALHFFRLAFYRARSDGRGVTALYRGELGLCLQVQALIAVLSFRMTAPYSCSWNRFRLLSCTRRATMSWLA